MLDVIVLAGGAARRLGGVSKGEVLVAGRAMLDHVLDAARGARHVVVVGPPGLARPGVSTVLEDPPRGGPVAGIEAGLEHLRRAGPGARPGAAGAPVEPAAEHLVVVLACDVPRAPAAVPHLLEATAQHPGADGAHLTDPAGRSQLVMVVREAALTGALDRLAAGPGVRDASVRRLVAELDLVDVADMWGYGRDADTWRDVAVLDTLLQEETRERP